MQILSRRILIMEYISGVIGKEYKQWKEGECIVIDAPTGAGKTHFIKNELARHALDNNESIFYLANRSALLDQFSDRKRKGEVEKTEAQSKEEIASELCITSMSYQKYALLESNSNGGKSLSEEMEKAMNARFWVLDEVHYFLADAQFNDTIEECLAKICGKSSPKKTGMLRNRILILMTATPDLLWIGFENYLNALLSQVESLYTQTIKFPLPKFLESPVEHKRLKPERMLSELLVFKELDDECKSYIGNVLRECISAEILQSEGHIGEWEIEKLVNKKMRNMKTLIDIKKEIDRIFPYTTKTFWKMQLSRVGKICNDNVNYYQKCASGYNITLQSDKDFWYYKTERDYRKVDVKYYETDPEIIETITKAPSFEKWIIFVNNKETGHRMCSKLQRRKIDAVFVSAESKKHPSEEDGIELGKIIDNEQFDVQVLISTSVLDNGVNIKDPQLKHIVINSMEKVQFLQMLGRKRFESESDSVTLYIKTLSVHDIRKYVEAHIIKSLGFLLNFQLTSSYEHTDYGLNRQRNLNYFHSKYLSVGKMYKKPYQKYIRMKNQSELGGLIDKKDLLKAENIPVDAYAQQRHNKQKLTYDYYSFMSFLERACNLRSEEPERYFTEQKTLWLKEQLSWIGHEYSDVNWVVESRHCRAKGELQQLLEEVSKLEYLDEEQRTTFPEQFRNCVDVLAPKLLRKGSNPSISSVNYALKVLGYPYYLESKKSSIDKIEKRRWSIRKDEKYPEELEDDLRPKE